VVRFAPRRDQQTASCGACSALRDAGLRPTRQRIALLELLDRHERPWVTAEALYSEVFNAHYPVSRASVSRTLRRLEQAGLLKRVPVSGSKMTCFVMQRPFGGRDRPGRDIERPEPA
jgi:Fe2+ or Zn2+ uptake regulation protein